jgi:hypothetical protein
MGAPPAPADVLVSEHAVSQFRERLRPALDPGPARTELEQLLKTGVVVAVAPEWARSASPRPYHLIIGDVIGLPLARQGELWLATTCVTRTSLTSEARADSTRRKASRMSAKRAQRRARF